MCTVQKVCAKALRHFRKLASAPAANPASKHHYDLSSLQEENLIVLHQSETMEASEAAAGQLESRAKQLQDLLHEAQRAIRRVDTDIEDTALYGNNLEEELAVIELQKAEVLDKIQAVQEGKAELVSSVSCIVRGKGYGTHCALQNPKLILSC
jgi:chromosome segregation ATPase